jgi:hypothetical protein
VFRHAHLYSLASTVFQELIRGRSPSLMKGGAPILAARWIRVSFLTMNCGDTVLEAQLHRRPGQPTVTTSSRAKELSKGEDLISELTTALWRATPTLAKRQYLQSTQLAARGEHPSWISPIPRSSGRGVSGSRKRWRTV